MARTDQVYIGRRGEFLAAYILECHGIRTTHVDLPHDDLWCHAPNGDLIRVQVKSTLCPRNYSTDRSIKKYHFKINSAVPYQGIYIFCALDKHLALAFKRDDTGQKSIKLNPDCFTREAQDESIRKAFLL